MSFVGILTPCLKIICQCQCQFVAVYPFIVVGMLSICCQVCHLLLGVSLWCVSYVGFRGSGRAFRVSGFGSVSGV
jgi:hypothetical protein